MDCLSRSRMSLLLWLPRPRSLLCKPYQKTTSLFLFQSCGPHLLLLICSVTSTFSFPTLIGFFALFCFFLFPHPLAHGLFFLSNGPSPIHFSLYLHPHLYAYTNLCGTASSLSLPFCSQWESVSVFFKDLFISETEREHVRMGGGGEKK